MTHRIADTFYDALAKLSLQEQKQVKQSAFYFQMDPSLLGFSTHRVDRARDPDFWTARVNRDIRMVIHKKDGQSLLARIGHSSPPHYAVPRSVEPAVRCGLQLQVVLGAPARLGVIFLRVKTSSSDLASWLGHLLDLLEGLIKLVRE